MIIWLSLFPPISSVPSRLGTWPTLRGIQGNGPVTAWKFTQFQTSQELCQEFYAQWWSEYWSQRTAFSSWNLGKGPTIRYPDPTPYQYSPVQSVDARVEGLSHIQGLVNGHETTWTTCSTTCEDTRPNIELYLSFRVERRIHSRQKKGFRIICPPYYWAQTYTAPDDCESSSSFTQQVERILLTTTPAYLNAVRLMHWHQFGPRIHGEVKRCRCVKDDRYDNITASGTEAVVTASVEAAGTSSVLLPALHEQMPYSDPHPYAEAADELSQAWDLWANHDFGASSSDGVD